MLLECIFLLCVSAVFILWLYGSVDKRFVALGNKIPGPVGYPIIGNAFSVPVSGPAILLYRRSMIREYGHITKFWIGNILLIFMSNPDDVEVVLKSSKHIDKSHLYKFLYRWLGTGLLTSTGEKWHTRRKAITPTFHFKILEQFVNVFNQYGDILVDCLAKHSDGIAFNVQPLISRYTLDVICKTAMGTEVDALINDNSTYVTAIREICTMIALRMRNPLLHSELIYYLSGYKSKEEKILNFLQEHTSNMIKEKSKQLSEKSESLQPNSNDEGIKTKTAFLEQLIKMKMGGSAAFRSDDDIREEVNTFTFEGHDTTSSAISFALVLLSRHRDVQEKIYKELQDIMETQDGKCNTYESLQLMKYLECVIKESLRLYPSVSAVARQIKEDLELPSGYTAPAGSTMFINIYCLHRNEKYFPNPEVFNPDHFLHENTVNRHPYAYLPFSAGPRNCVGQKFAMLELKSVLSKIILNYIIEKAADDWDLVEDSNLVLQSLSGHMIKLRKRNGDGQRMKL